MMRGNRVIKKGNRRGIGLMAGGLALVILAVVPVRFLVFAAGVGLLAAGAYASARCK